MSPGSTLPWHSSWDWPIEACRPVIGRDKFGDPGRFAGACARSAARMREGECSILEVKINFEPGYRVDCTQHTGQFILILVGGDKALQPDDIATAQALAKEM